MIGTSHPGYCPICESPSHFYTGSEWLRDYYICVNCRSNPRQRALMVVLKLLHPNYKEMSIHETSPDGANSKKLAEDCPGYSSSQYLSNVEFGQTVDGVRCESVESLTFDDESFDLFISQDVFEHVMNPITGFVEVMRILKPGGAHIFTVPRMPNHKTVTRARLVNGEIEYLLEKEYHQNPVDPEGSLVVTSWGNDMRDILMRECNLELSTYTITDRTFGLDGAFLDVFVIRK